MYLFLHYTKSVLCRDEFDSLLVCHFVITEPAMSVDVKARAVDEMMERIKKGIVLKPTQKPPQVNRFKATVLYFLKPQI